MIFYKNKKIRQKYISILFDFFINNNNALNALNSTFNYILNELYININNNNDNNYKIDISNKIDTNK